MSQSSEINFDTLKPAEFELYLPEFFASGDGKVSHDPRLRDFLARNPDCAALVRDLETIAETARSLFEPVDDPSEKVWSNIQSKLREESAHPVASNEFDSADDDDTAPGVLKEID